MRTSCKFVLVAVCILAHSAFGTVRRVPLQYPTIQAAISAAQDGDTVLVAEGMYYENVLIENKSIIIASFYFMDGDTAHIARTVINGSRPIRPDSGSVVIITSCKDTTTEICGFTITGGTGTIRTPGAPGSPPYPLRLGGGVLCWNSSARIRGNHVVDNVCTIDVPDGHAQGAGIACAPPFTSNQVLIDGGNTIARNTARAKGPVSSWELGWAQGGGIFSVCSGRIERNWISSNVCRSEHGYAVGAGIRLMSWGTTTVKDNDIIGNSSESSAWNAFAGGVSCSGANMVLDGNRIIGNSVRCTGGATANGAGVYLDLDNDVNWAVIISNRIKGNSSPAGTSYGGAIGMYRSSPEIINNIIDGNSAIYGGAISAYEKSKPRLVNNTIISNTASLGGAVYAAHASIHPMIVNTILWDNTASSMGSEIYLDNGANATVIYSDVESGWTGDGNISGDPLLHDSTYRLSDSSPCIGAGIDSVEISGVWYFAPSRCFYGGLRPSPAGTHPDIGACESPFGTATAIYFGDRVVPDRFDLKQNYPNPFNPSTTIRYGLPHKSSVQLTVFNTLGQQVAELVHGEKEAGYHEVKFDAGGLPSGVYFYRLQAGNFVETRKLLLVK